MAAIAGVADQSVSFSHTPPRPMLNRSAIGIGHTPAFIAWLKNIGVSDESIRERLEVAEKTLYLIPAIFYPEECDEVLEDLYEEIFRQELRAWEADETYWPDMTDFELFNRWFTVEAYAEVRDAGLGSIEQEV